MSLDCSHSALALIASILFTTTPAALAGGDCCSPNIGPGCSDDECEAQVCAVDPFCCQDTWDSLCADMAQANCDACDVGQGDCCVATGFPGCNDPACQAIVCLVDPFCCSVTWDQECAAAANLLCLTCLGPNSDCCSNHATPGCDDDECEATVCAVDPFCCDSAWDSTCASEAELACEVCGGSGSLPAGACCLEAGGCEVLTSVACARPQVGGTFQGVGTSCDACIVPTCPGSGDCCTPTGTPGCADSDCCELICSTDEFCCSVAWDDDCAAQAVAQCPACAEPGDCPTDIDGDGMTGSTDLNILLFAFGRDAEGDVNGDGTTDSFDLNILLFEFGEPCPT